jgi:microcystin-dependent protein|uniref:Phage tail collar domain-containing protein n=1 Tax=viral metagenome TaxID=1070528 RepID=A0A6C0IT54_9ZZZZ
MNIKLESRDYIVIILVCAFFYLKYENSCSKNNIEKMTETKDISSQIKAQIKTIYNTDIQAIRNLSDISKKLQVKGITLPGDLTVEGKFNYLPTGSIMAFNKAVAPPGWAVCDGTKGTPDLRGRFIRMHSGASKQFNAPINVSYDKSIAGNSRSDIRSRILKHKFGETAGTDHHALITNEIPKHNHGVAGNHTHTYSRRKDDRCVHKSKCYRRAAKNGYQTLNTGASGNHTHAYVGANWGHNNQPPYYVLTYIMKL